MVRGSWKLHIWQKWQNPISLFKKIKNQYTYQWHHMLSWLKKPWKSAVHAETYAVRTLPIRSWGFPSEILRFNDFLFGLARDWTRINGTRYICIRPSSYIAREIAFSHHARYPSFVLFLLLIVFRVLRWLVLILFRFSPSLSATIGGPLEGRERVFALFCFLFQSVCTCCKRWQRGRRCNGSLRILSPSQ